jgi:hypothetical protein
MTDFDDLDTSDREERAALRDVAERLGRERPIPAAGFRSRLRSSLVSGRSSRGEAARTRIFALSCAGLGAAMLLVAALGTVAVGPFAA